MYMFWLPNLMMGFQMSIYNLQFTLFYFMRAIEHFFLFIYLHAFTYHALLFVSTMCVCNTSSFYLFVVVALDTCGSIINKHDNNYYYYLKYLSYKAQQSCLNASVRSKQTIHTIDVSITEDQFNVSLLLWQWDQSNPACSIKLACSNESAGMWHYLLQLAIYYSSELINGNFAGNNIQISKNTKLEHGVSSIWLSVFKIFTVNPSHIHTHTHRNSRHLAVLFDKLLFVQLDFKMARKISSHKHRFTNAYKFANLKFYTSRHLSTFCFLCRWLVKKKREEVIFRSL